MNKKKIFFIPNYFYLNLPVFEQVINELGDKVNSYIVQVPGNTKFSVDKKYNLSYFNNKRIRFSKIPIITFYYNGVINKLKALYFSIKNFRKIGSFLKEIKPNLIVVGSDLGNLSIRFFLEYCMLLRIPILILYTCDIPIEQNKFLFSCLDNLLFYYKTPFFRFFRSIFFKGNIVGTYALNAKICVISEEFKRKLIRKGIEQERIIVIGLPIVFSNNVLDKVYTKLGISKKQKIVVFFTECIQNVYGEEYTKNLYKNLAEIFKNLSDNKISVIIKLHPLEDEKTKLFIRGVFKKSPFKIVKNFSAEELINISDLCIAHFSRVLINAVLMEKRFLSINLMKDKKRTFIPKEDRSILEINSFEDLKIRVKGILKSPEHGRRIDKAIAHLSKKFSYSDSVEKITSLILDTVKVNPVE